MAYRGYALRSRSRASKARSTEASEVASLVHQAEREAYSFVLRAFKYQAEELSWEKQELMIDLRKELRIADDEHKHLLHITNSDETLNNIRSWRRTSGYQSGSCSTSQPARDALPSRTNLTPRKRRQTSNLYSSAGPAREHHTRDCNLYSSLPSKAPAQAEALNPLIGRKAMIRWPSEEKFYEVTVADYDPLQGMHMLVYDGNELNGTFEWADINKIPLENIQWIGEDPGTALRVGHSGRGYMTGSVREGDIIIGAERRREQLNLEANEEFPSQQNVIGNGVEPEIVLMNTEVLIREVEDVIAVNSPNSLEYENAKQKLKQQEQDLEAAIALLDKLSPDDNERDAEERG